MKAKKSKYPECFSSLITKSIVQHSYSVNPRPPVQACDLDRDKLICVQPLDPRSVLGARISMNNFRQGSESQAVLAVLLLWRQHDRHDLLLLCRRRRTASELLPRVFFVNCCETTNSLRFRQVFDVKILALFGNQSAVDRFSVNVWSRWQLSTCVSRCWCFRLLRDHMEEQLSLPIIGCIEWRVWRNASLHAPWNYQTKTDRWSSVRAVRHCLALHSGRQGFCLGLMTRFRAHYA